MFLGIVMRQIYIEVAQILALKSCWGTIIYQQLKFIHVANEELKETIMLSHPKVNNQKMCKARIKQD